MSKKQNLQKPMPPMPPTPVEDETDDELEYVPQKTTSTLYQRPRASPNLQQPNQRKSEILLKSIKPSYGND
jgi:hypothetical protein